MAKQSKVYKTRQSLLMRLKNTHDEASWEEFVATYRNYIMTIISNLQVNQHDAEDLTARVFFRALIMYP